MAGQFSRRTHIVRISMDDPPTPSGEQPTSYIDVEVLDAISFRDDRDKEMVLNLKASEASPWITDNTGGGNGKQPGDPTRRSHMKLITGDDPTQQLYVEVVDAIAFRGENGDEWILDMGKTSDSPVVFDTTDGSGDTTATRRVHNEKISGDLTDPNPTSYLTVQRNDNIAFREIMGREMIIKCASNDDPLSSSPRASTFMTPQGYNPQDTSASAVVPPSLAASGDQSVYIARVKGSSGYMTGSPKIQQGPFWWIRNVSSGGTWIVLSITAGAANNNPTPPGFPEVTFDFGDDTTSPTASLIDKTETTNTTTTPAGPGSFVYFVWNNAAPFPTIDTYGDLVFAVPPFRIPYFAQFAQLVNLNNGGFSQPRPNLPGGDPDYPGGQYGGTGQFSSLADAEAYASRFNAAYASDGFTNAITDYFGVTGAVNLGLGVPATVFATFIALPATDTGSATATLIGTYGIKIPKSSESFSVHVSNPGVVTTGNRTSSISALGYSSGSAPGQAPPDEPDSDDVLSAVSTQSGGTTYGVETEVVTDPDGSSHVHIVITGGDAPGGGGGAR